MQSMPPKIDKAASRAAPIDFGKAFGMDDTDSFSSKQEEGDDADDGDSMSGSSAFTFMKPRTTTKPALSLFSPTPADEDDGETVGSSGGLSGLNTSSGLSGFSMARPAPPRSFSFGKSDSNSNSSNSAAASPSSTSGSLATSFGKRKRGDSPAAAETKPLIQPLGTLAPKRATLFGRSSATGTSNAAQSQTQPPLKKALLSGSSSGAPSLFASLPAANSHEEVSGDNEETISPASRTLPQTQNSSEKEPAQTTAYEYSVDSLYSSYDHTKLVQHVTAELEEIRAHLTRIRDEAMRRVGLVINKQFAGLLRDLTEKEQNDYADQLKFLEDTNNANSAIRATVHRAKQTRRHFYSAATSND